MKIIVTGGAGFIGSAVIRQALERDHEVVNVDALTYASCLDNLASVEDKPEYHFEHADICDADRMRSVFETYLPDAIMHLAAESHVDRSIDGPQAFINTNIIGTYQILQAAKDFWYKSSKSDTFRFLHVSTDEVFGSLGDDGMFTETTPYAPNSPYSASKASSDHLVRAWHHTYGLPVVLTNCSNNYGPFQFPEKLIPVIIYRALEGESIPVYGKGMNIRDWLYVEDHATALLEVLEKGTIGDSYNVGGDNEARNIDIVRTVCELLDELRPKETPYFEQVAYVDDRPGHDHRYAIDASYIRDKLGWRPSMSLIEGLRKTVEWYLANDQWTQMLLTRENVGQRLGKIS